MVHGNRKMMRGLNSHLLILIFGGICAALSACAIPSSRRSEGEFELSFAAGSRDSAGNFLGGTVVRLLTGHGGRLYAGNGYWEDRPGPEGPQGAQILVLDRPGGRWRVDHAFEERLPSGRWRDLAVGALSEAVFARDDGSGAWAAVELAHDRPAADFLPQIRSFGSHRDRVTGVDLAFAGEM